ncbi:Protein kinase-like domain [Pseudocohnilembus persalinus]|uniref:Protein kinase-like domain n=1 Tax=Pseudocohnilembus persalinus TaxID=266149 RepID=A0A0V0R4T8_PSEPJ|nr:Protein kinase-like domain [Pseudocohnilembus persalinus]|eukprot:KRX09481.1 Protein kinase-like domain [Pseudocohnilembus persalinus]
MGGNNSTAKVEQLYNPEEYTVWKTQYNDIRYGKVNILKENSSGMLVCEMDRTITTEEEFNQKVNHAEGRSQLQHPSLVSFLKYSTKKNEEFCSTFYKISFLYEYVKIDLKEQIILRSWNDTLIPFEENELWYILKSAVEGLSYLKAKDIIHGDIRPSQIFLTDLGQVKLGEQFQQQSSLSGYQQLLTEQRKEEFFVSPNVYESLKNKGDIYQYDQAANDVFALGLTLLEAALLKQTDLMYGEEFTFKEEVLHQYLDELKSKYSQELYDVISSMLIESEQDRPTLEEIQAQLQEKKQANGVQLYILSENDEIIQNPEQTELIQEEVVIEENAKRQAQPVGQGIQLIPEEQKEYITPAISGYDLSQIEERINRVLQQSKHTVQQYGGAKGNEVYESYKPEYTEPIRQSNVQTSVTYTTYTRPEQQQYYGSYQPAYTSNYNRTYQSYQQPHYNPISSTTYHNAPQNEQDDDYIPLPAGVAQQKIKTSENKPYVSTINQQTTEFQQQSQQQQQDLDKQIQESLERSKQLEENIRKSQFESQQQTAAQQQ